MKILSIHDYPPYVLGGAESQAKRLVTEWIKHGCEVCSAAHRTPEGWINLTDTDRVYVSHIKAKSRFRVIRALKFTLRLAYWLMMNAKSADIIYFRILGEGALTAITLRALGLISTPIVSCPGSFGTSGDAAIIKSLPLSKLLVRMINRYCDAINILAGPIANELEELGINPEKFVYIPNGIPIAPPPTRFFGKSTKFIYAGRCEPTKGLIPLIEAWNNFYQNSHNSPTLTIIGDGSILSNLKELVRRHKLENCVIFKGRITIIEVREHLQENNVLILPSNEEGFSNIALEAMEAGIPILITRLGGIDTYITKQSGWIIESNSVTAIENALREVNSTPQHVLAEMGKEARRIAVTNFEINEIAKKHLSLFRKILSNE